MEGSKEYFLRMREEEFLKLSAEQRNIYTYIECREVNEFEANKDDTMYLALKKAESKAKKKTQEYLFNKRHKL